MLKKRPLAAVWGQTWGEKTGEREARKWPLFSLGPEKSSKAWSCAVEVGQQAWISQVRGGGDTHRLGG